MWWWLVPAVVTLLLWEPVITHRRDETLYGYDVLKFAKVSFSLIASMVVWLVYFSLRTIFS